MVSVIIPMRNEEQYISKCLDSLLHQTYPAGRYEILVVDGNSSDRSAELVEQAGNRGGAVRLLDNPAGIVPTGMNLGIKSARGEIIVRADAHTVYPPDYIENGVKYLAQTGADNVGGPVTTEAANASFGARLVASILTNRFGVGNSHFRTSTTEGYVDTVPFGTFRRDLFDRIGLFNEKLVRNQDNELNARIRGAGGKIYLTPALTTRYFPPASFFKLLRQTYRNSQWHLFTVRESGNVLAIRHLLPAVFSAAVIVLGVAALFSKLAMILFELMMCTYFLAAAYFAFRARYLSLPLKFVMPFGFFCFHFVYGIGTLAGLKFVWFTPAGRPVRL